MPAGRNGGPEDSRVHGDVLKELLSDVGSMQGRQEHVDQLLTDMKKENEALWREVAVLRQKHHKQQQIVEKVPPPVPSSELRMSKLYSISRVHTVQTQACELN